MVEVQRKLERRLPFFSGVCVNTCVGVAIVWGWQWEIRKCKSGREARASHFLMPCPWPLGAWGIGLVKSCLCDSGPPALGGSVRPRTDLANIGFTMLLFVLSIARLDGLAPSHVTPGHPKVELHQRDRRGRRREAGKEGKNFRTLNREKLTVSQQFHLALIEDAYVDVCYCLLLVELPTLCRIRTIAVWENAHTVWTVFLPVFMKSLGLRLRPQTLLVGDSRNTYTRSSNSDFVFAAWFAK